MALYHFSAKVFSRSSRNTVNALAYRAGCKLYDERTGQTFNYQKKDVQHVELVLPKDAPLWVTEIQKLIAEDRQKGVQAFCNIVEGAEKRIDAQVWREFEFALHRELTDEQNIALAREFVEDQICFHGMTAQLNFHFDVDKKTGEFKPHCHVLVTTRRLEENGLSPKKERDWNHKEFLCELRVKWEEYSNFHLKLNGHDIQIDHRSNIERGIEMEPQPKLGRGVLEQERRLQLLEGGETYSPITERARIFHDTQLRNLYRIVRNPNVILDIATKHHSTFTWTDVQKVLHRHVDEVPLFQRLEAKLKNSNELLLLRSDERLGNIYTTHTMLKAERTLIETAESLNQLKTHGVEKVHIDHGIEKANQALADKGGLSKDQVHAIRHLVDEGQIKCVVGIAGAGKTTALGVCHEIWKTQGYAVYGMTPTGKAAQNLEQSGIKSTTLHKFLKSFGEGRCQYNENSILVLDEAGMVDVERFGKLLEAVQKLGVKLIVVGDGAQLQPVEAGPAFRLVTTRLGRSELNTVVRQKEDWQREATVLFGQQKTCEALQRYVDKGCVHIIEEEASQQTIDTNKAFDKREKTKEVLVQSWHTAFKESPNKSSLILAHSNRDVNDLNKAARSVLKESGHLSKKEFTYKTKKEVEDDFGRKKILQEEKPFSQGDRIVFTRNNYGLGVKNGTMGTITGLNKEKVQVKLDDGKDISFAPNLNPHFDQGWAVTIHKSQGTTVDHAYVLASYEMTQNLAYVAMTRHRETVKMFGSSLDFWSAEKLPEILSKIGEKLGPADYLDEGSLSKLMEKEDKILTKIFERVSNELEAMGAVTKRVFWKVADHFLGRTQKPDILPESKEPTPIQTYPLQDAQKVHTNLAKTCEKILYAFIAKENISMTAELKERVPLQAERAANFIFYAHNLNGTEPTEKETKHFLLRAKYELDRIPQIKEKLTNEWQKRGNFDAQKDPLLIHMIAERQASIEGRLFLEAKQEGLKPPYNLSQLAEVEFKAHRAEAKTLAQELSTNYSLSKNAATECAKNMLRYQETHGTKPTDTQMTAMAEIARQIEEKYPDFLEKDLGSHNLIYLRRMDADSMFKERCYENRHAIAHEHDILKMQEKALLEVQKQRIEQEVLRQKERDFSMSM
jgi:Ti-type conjugative transfer relaxase TraA